MLKVISVGLVYDCLHEKFLVVRQSDERGWTLPSTNAQAGIGPALSLAHAIFNATAIVISRPRYLGHTLPGQTELNDWQRIYWLCRAMGSVPKVNRPNRSAIIQAEYVDRSMLESRLSGRMPAPYAVLLQALT